MSEPYTPNTRNVRAAWVATGIGSEDALSAEFDRWLAGIKADAWDAGVEAQMDADENGNDAPDNPYEEAAWKAPSNTRHG